MEKKTRRIRRFSFGLARLLLVLILLLSLLYWGNNAIDAEEYALSFPALPPSFDGFRIVELSDLHGKEFGRENARLVDAIKKTRPDLIAITGDFVDDEREFPSAGALVRKLAQIAPVYYVTGNHEWATRRAKEFMSLLELSGATVLQNEYVPLTLFDGTLILAGADDPNGPYDMKTPEELTEEIRRKYPGAFIVLLAHRNNRFDEYAAAGATLVLSGHAHGGIIRLPFTDGLFGPSNEWFPKYTNGVYTLGGTTMVVSRGLGNVGRTFRVFNRPHLPVVVLSGAGR